ncbi:MAG: hypothetical protein Q7R87_05105 [Nanoarchaeota archaeon]|nr:hypothetical protein [Nanoarchaeota archaeon]
MNFRAGLVGLSLLVGGCSTFSPSLPTRVVEAKAVLLDGIPAVKYKVSDPSELLGYGRDLLLYDVGFDGVLDRVEIGNGKKPLVIEGKENLNKYLPGFKFAEDFWASHTGRHPSEKLREEYDLMKQKHPN